jgi:hypothetical protein
MFNKKRKRGLCCWKKQGETTLILGGDTRYTLHCFDTPELTSGLHRWSIKVMEGYDEVFAFFLGVVCPAVAPAMMEADGSLEWSQMKEAVWFLSSHRTKHHGARQQHQSNFPHLSDGSIVKFSLDIRQESSGTLSFSVGEGQEYVLFEDMDSVRMNNGLLPAIWARGTGKFEILSMESEE